eukprot:9027513-Lingulodinium_polyedra.AAC.1
MKTRHIIDILVCKEQAQSSIEQDITGQHNTSNAPKHMVSTMARYLKGEKGDVEISGAFQLGPGPARRSNTMNQESSVALRTNMPGLISWQSQ